MKVAYHFTFSALFELAHDPFEIKVHAIGKYWWYYFMSLTCEVHKKGIHSDNCLA